MKTQLLDDFMATVPVPDRLNAIQLVQEAMRKLREQEMQRGTFDAVTVTRETFSSLAMLASLGIEAVLIRDGLEDTDEVDIEAARNKAKDDVATATRKAAERRKTKDN